MTYGIWSTVFFVCVVCVGGGAGVEGQWSLNETRRKREVIRLFIFILLLQ